jgi:hypothetical protein
VVFHDFATFALGAVQYVHVCMHGVSVQPDDAVDRCR